MKAENWIEDNLADLRVRHQFRSLSPLPHGGGRIAIDGHPHINFSSNDYLDFLVRPELKAAAIAATERCGVGSGASRLVTGDLALHEELEAKLARHKGYPASLIFGSGFLTNLGVVTALMGADDTIYADRLVHASLIDAIRLSGARLQRFSHNDMDDLAHRLHRHPGRGRKLIVTESVFSMDGDLCPIEALAELAARHDAMLMIDDAHATGVFGSHGCGLVRARGQQDAVNLTMCTFSKALGGYGGGVACSPSMRDWLINKARALIYTTALPPPVCGAAIAALEILELEPWLGEQLLDRAARFRTALNEAGFDTGKSSSHIIPVLIGENEPALRLAAALREEHLIATAIRPPTVPPGTARLRFSVTLAHREDDLSEAVAKLTRCAKAVGLR
jgi:8-amino-7-oxononanoate synthase